MESHYITCQKIFLKRVQDATLALLSTFKNQCLDLLKKKVFNLENIWKNLNLENFKSEKCMFCSQRWRKNELNSIFCRTNTHCCQTTLFCFFLGSYCCYNVQEGHCRTFQRYRVTLCCCCNIRKTAKRSKKRSVTSLEVAIMLKVLLA